VKNTIFDVFASIISFNKDVTQSAVNVQKKLLTCSDVTNMKKSESTQKTAYKQTGRFHFLEISLFTQ